MRLKEQCKYCKVHWMVGELVPNDLVCDECRPGYEAVLADLAFDLHREYEEVARLKPTTQDTTAIKYWKKSDEEDC